VEWLAAWYGVREDVDHAPELEQVEQALDSALRPGHDYGCVGFGPERGDGLKQGADARAVQEAGGGEVDDEVAMAAADLAGYCVFQVGASARSSSPVTRTNEPCVLKAALVTDDVWYTAPFGFPRPAMVAPEAGSTNRKLPAASCDGALEIARLAIWLWQVDGGL
jgi:hypothetical protein